MWKEQTLLGVSSALRELAIQPLELGLQAQAEGDVQDGCEAFGQRGSLELLPVGGAGKGSGPDALPAPTSPGLQLCSTNL